MKIRKSLSISRFYTTVMGLALMSLCSPAQAKPQEERRMSGVVADDPNEVEKIPLAVSEEHLKKKMKDAKDGILSTDVTASVSNQRGGSKTSDRTKPVVSIVAPASGAIISGLMSMQVSASDNVGVKQVIINVDGVNKATLLAAPYSYSLNADALAAGTHTLKATASDAAGNSQSASIQVGVNAIPLIDVTPPSVSITSPTHGSALNQGDALNVAVSASDAGGISAVSLLLDGVSAGSDLVAPYSFSLSSSALAAGAHTLTASAKDNAGNESQVSIAITVNTAIIPSSPLPSSMSLFMPPVRNQGSEGSCVAFAVGYAVRSAEYFYGTNALFYSDSVNTFSPEFLYDQTKITDCNGGSSLQTALNFINSSGIVPWSSMPYSSSNGCSLVPTVAQQSEALNYRTSSYTRLYTSDLTAMKTMLVNHHALVTAVAIDSSFIHAGPSFIWRTSLGLGAAHAIAIVGYDDSKHAIKIMNSWGTGWGDQGYSWIDYDLLPQISSAYTYSMNN